MTDTKERCTHKQPIEFSLGMMDKWKCPECQNVFGRCLAENSDGSLVGCEEVVEYDFGKMCDDHDHRMRRTSSFEINVDEYEREDLA